MKLRRIPADHERQLQLMSQFIDHYNQSTTKPAVVAFLTALGTLNCLNGGNT